MTKKWWVLIVLVAVLFFSFDLARTQPEMVFYGPEAISSECVETPVVLVDPLGNAHIIWVGDCGGGLFYKMVDSEGRVIIEEINVTPSTDPDWHVHQPALAMDAAGNLHVFFYSDVLYTGFNGEEYATSEELNANEVIYTKLNPLAYLAPGRGTIDDLIEIKETIISTEDFVESWPPRIAYDQASNRLHVVWLDGNEDEDLDLVYLVLDTDGDAVISPAVLTSGLFVYAEWGGPEIAVNAVGQASIIYVAAEDGGLPIRQEGEREIYYTMAAVEAGNGVTLIDDVRITDDDGHGSVKPRMALDDDGNVHVAWHDRRLYDEDQGEHEIYYSKLEPVPNEDGGEPVREPRKVAVGGDGDGEGYVNILIDQARVTANDDFRSHMVSIAVDSCGRVHVVWADARDELQYEELYYQIFDTTGDQVNQILAATRLTTDGADLDPTFRPEDPENNIYIAFFVDTLYVVFNGDYDGEDVSNIFLMLVAVDPCNADEGGGSYVFNPRICFVGQLI